MAKKKASKRQDGGDTLGGIAESLGTLLGNAERQWRAWEGPRTAVVKAVTDVRDRAAALLSEIRRVLVTRGTLLVTTPAHDLPRRVLLALLRWEEHFDPLGQHVRFYRRRSMTRTLETNRAGRNMSHTQASIRSTWIQPPSMCWTSTLLAR